MQACHMEEPARADVQQGVTTNIPAIARHDDRLGMLEIVRADHAVMHNVADIRASVGLDLFTRVCIALFVALPTYCSSD